MFITMKETRRVSEDGFSTRLLENGKTYDVADTAARDCIKQKWATETESGHTLDDIVDAICIDLARKRAERMNEASHA